MPNTGDINAIYCPSCGASVEMQGNQGSCIYCGAVVERQASSGTTANPRFTVTQTQLGAPPPSSYSTFNQPTPARRSPGCMLGLAMSVMFTVIGIVIGLLIAGQSLSRSLFGNVGATPAPSSRATAAPAPSPAPNNESDAPPAVTIGNINEMLVALPRDGPADLLVYVNNPNDQGLSLVRIDGGSHAALWKSQPLSKEVYQGLLVAGADMAYLTDHERLLALHLSDGSVAWEAPLVAEPVTGCHDCLRLIKDHVVVLQKDGSLQGFDTRSGQRSWSISLDDPPRRLPVVDGRLLLFQTAERGRQLLSLIDPANGKATGQIEPTCPREDNSDEEPLRSDSTLLFEPDGKTMYALYGFFSQCAQRWDLTNGKLVWETPLGQDKPTGWSGEDSPLLADGMIFFNPSRGDEGALSALDTSTGKLRTVITKKKAHFVPVAARDGILIALTWPTWDTKKQSLVGLDARTGEQRWEFTSQTEGSRLSESHGNWDWRMTPKGLLSIQVLEDQKQLVVETIDLRTGASTGQQITPLDDSGSQVFWDVLWGDDTAWLDIGRFVYVLDLATGTTMYRLD
jgi:outer membrane protein assembly factor BamB